ncbi:MAG: AAA family ATP:ADP antiporter [Paraglaciecola sp.]
MELVDKKHLWYEKLLNLFSHVRPGEGKSCLVLTLNACLMMACFYLLKVIREPLILAHGGAELKSYATALQAGLLIFIVPAFSAFYHHYSSTHSRTFIINRLLQFFIANLMIFALLQMAYVDIAVSFYVWLGIFNVMVLAQFWAFVADTYNVRSGQRLFVIIAAGAALGSLLGAKMAGPLLPAIGISGIMVLAALLLLIILALSNKASQWVPDYAKSIQVDEKPNTSNVWLEGFNVVFKSKYLVHIAVFIVLLNFINSTGEYILATFVVEYTQGLVELGQTTDSLQTLQGQFYSTYNTWITSISFVLQLFLVSRLFKWIGVRGSILVLPCVILISYGFILFFPLFSIIKLAMIGEKSINYSLQNTAQQILFLPVPRKDKYIGKMTIDTFFFRFGDLIYGAFVYVGVVWFDLPLKAFIISNIICALMLFFIAWRIGYFNRLAVQKNFGNSPPKLAANIPGLNIPAGVLSQFTISENTFVDPDLGDALKFKAHSESGKSLPDWVEFDRYSRTFSFTPPAQSTGRQVIKVVAVDFEGLMVSSTLVVVYGNDSN